jgi:hypothetical protein
MHPLQPNITGLTDQELENKITELTKKYFQALRVVPGAAQQVSMMLDGYKWEQQRRLIEKQKRTKDDDPAFDDLIKID